MIRRASLAGLLLVLAPLSPGFAQTAAPAAAGPSVPADPTNAPSPLVQKAQGIDDLIAGKLAPDVDAADLFTSGLGTGDAAVVRAVVATTKDRALFDRASKNASALAPLSADQSRLAIAQARFLRLPEAKRKRLLSDHAARAAAWRRQQAKTTEGSARLDELRGQVARLKAFLAGQPAPPNTLSINLLDDLSGLEAQPSGKAQSSPGSRDLDTLEGLRARLGSLRRQVLALPADRLAALERSAGVGASAEAAALAAEGRMRQAAQSAQNERERIIATEQAKLYATKAAQSRFEAAVAALEASPEQIQDDALAWRRQVQDVEELPCIRGSWSPSRRSRW